MLSSETALAGLRFNAASTATGDIDILVDDRNKLRLLAEDDQEIGLIRLIQDSVDKTFLPLVEQIAPALKQVRHFVLMTDRVGGTLIPRHPGWSLLRHVMITAI